MAHGKTAVTKDGIPYRPSLDGLPPRSIAPSKAARTITWVILAVVACYFLLPIIWLVIASTKNNTDLVSTCLLYTSPSPRDLSTSRMPSSA